MTTFNFTDKVVVITGAGNGIGKVAAEHFAAAGAQLALNDINSSAIADVAHQLREKGTEVYFSSCDVSNATQVAAFFENTMEAFGKIDVAVNNAGIAQPHQKIADTDEATFDRLMNVNVKGVFLCMKQQLQYMKESGGVITNLASVAGLVGTPTVAVYNATKHAVVGLTKTAAAEYAKYNIRVNAICPFITMTNMFEETLETLPEREAAIAHLTSVSPMKRAAKPEEIVNGILWASSSENSFTTGQTIAIDGGMTTI